MTPWLCYQSALFYGDLSIMSSVRKQAPRLARPAARYWKGKAPKGVSNIASGSDSDEPAEGQAEGGDILIQGDQLFIEENDSVTPVQPEPIPLVKGMSVVLKDVDIRDGKVIVAGREESGRTAMEEDGMSFSDAIYKLIFSRI